MSMIEHLYSIFKQYPYLSTDSRKIRKDSIFFGLKGENYDGNDYVNMALEHGAAFAVTDRVIYADDARCLVVENTLLTLQQLAAFHRQQFEIPVIGLTGSNGKTTTKELLSKILQKKYKQHATLGNLNNHIGVPLTLMGLNEETEIAIIEMGANHKGEIADLCRIAQPDYGIITNIGKAHLEGFGSFEGVIEAKSELYRYIGQKKGKIFRNSEDTLLRKLAGEIFSITYGSDDTATCRGKILSMSPYLRIQWYSSAGKKIIETKFINKYQFDNIMAAICIGTYFKVQPDDIIAAIEDYIPENNRSQLIVTDKNTLILDAYNANPSSMELSIRDFAAMECENKVLILGDMLELGRDSEKEHQYILDLIKTFSIEQVFLVGEIFHSLGKKTLYKSFESTMRLKEWLTNHPVKDATVFLKASRKIGLENLVETL